MLQITYEQPQAPQQIQELALQLSGLTAPPENSDALYQATLSWALNLCNRQDVPAAMEEPLALLLARAYTSHLDRPVSTVKRGDTSITYASTGDSAYSLQALLTPFIRLRSV